MTKDNATPRPWQIGLDSHGTSIDAKINGNWYPIADINVPMIAELGSDNAMDMQEANAELIVKAVNCHDDFISLAQSVMKLDCPEHIHVMAYKLLKKARQ